MIIAAIDIGSNAARLLINEVKVSPNQRIEFIKLNLLRIPLRLGMDVFTKGEIGEEREKMMLDCMKIFCDLMKTYKVQHYRACATSAMRDAKNGLKIIRKIKKNLHLDIEIISGDQEATLIYENHIAEGLDKNFAYLYIDVGGGSTELTYYQNAKLHYKKSLNIGTIRLLQNRVKEEDWKELKQIIKTHIISKKKIVAIGSGGNINKVFSMSGLKDGKPLSRLYLKKMVKQLQKLTIEERMATYNIREDRADVLLPALEIYTKILYWAKIEKIFVPKISVADGIIHSIYDELKIKK